MAVDQLSSAGHLLVGRGYRRIRANSRSDFDNAAVEFMRVSQKPGRHTHPICQRKKGSTAGSIVAAGLAAKRRIAGMGRMSRNVSPEDAISFRCVSGTMVVIGLAPGRIHFYRALIHSPRSQSVEVGLDFMGHLTPARPVGLYPRSEDPDVSPDQTQAAFGMCFASIGAGQRH